MTLQQLQQSFMKDAEFLGDYQLLTKTELANGYCDAEEAANKAREEGKEKDVAFYESLRSAYYSALMVRYWFKIYEWINNSSSLQLEQSEFVNWLAECLNDAFYYRGWRFEYKAVVKDGKFIDWKYDEQGNKIKNDNYYLLDPNAPDKNINFFIKAKRGKVYQYYNKDKRKTCVQNYSLDEMIDENGDYAVNYAGAYVEPEENKVKYLIDEFLRRDEGVEALIIDGIANYDTYKQTKVTRTETCYDEETGEEYEEDYSHYKNSFDPRKLVRHLNNLNEEFINQFCKVYKVEKVDGDAIYSRLKKMNNSKLYKYIEKTLIEVRQDASLMDCLL